MDSVYSINIERAVLSSILFNPEELEDVLGVLKPKDFYLPAHKKIFEVMVKLHGDDMPIDEEFIRKRVDTKDVDDSILLEILSANPITNTLAYVREIKDGSVKRELASLATTIKKVAIEEEMSANEALDTIQGELYIIDKQYDNNKNWAEYIVENPDKKFKVAMYDYEKTLKHFSINVSRIKINNNLIVTLTDITFEIEQIEFNKEKDRIFFQQSKISAIADILKNIGHQWRQPLSIISTITSGMKLHKELNILEEKDFIESCNTIITNTNKLSNTIESFTSFFDNDEKNNKYSLVETIENIKKFMDSIFEKNNIECIFSFNDDLVLDCKQNELSQAILNILDNSIHALIHNQDENSRFIFIEFKNKILQIKDSGNGIDETIITKILEPYFTTKHQSFGVGLGLHMVNEFFVKTLGYKIDIKNIIFTHKKHNYKGTNFIINFD